jgi:hypothetical protein
LTHVKLVAEEGLPLVQQHGAIGGHHKLAAELHTVPLKVAHNAAAVAEAIAFRSFDLVAEPMEAGAAGPERDGSRAAGRT